MLKRLFIATALPLACAVLFAGCGSGDTYNPTLDNGGLQGDFTVAVYQGDPDSVGNGGDQTPVSAQNPLQVPFDSSRQATIVVTSQNGFSGTVTLSVGQVTGPFDVSNPSPASVNLPANGFQNSTITVSHVVNTAASRKSRGQTNSGTAVVTATSGSTSHSVPISFVAGGGEE